jgi:capsular polysaccharide transport system ATP-binding protein
MIELQGVTKTYKTRDGHNVVLDRVSTVFPSRTNVGILGRNGAGKSTLLRILSGAESADEGRIYRRGRVSWPIGFSGGFNSSLTGKENSRFIARLYGAEVDAVSTFALEFSELGSYFHEPVRTYSSGMRARLAFALSMAMDFDYYLVDEVTAVGDSRFQKKCRLAFQDRSARSSVIMVSHNMGTIQDYCTRFAVLSGGKLIEFDSIDEATKAYED